MSVSREVLEAYAITFGCAGAVLGLCFVLLMYIVDSLCILIVKYFEENRTDRVIKKLQKKVAKRMKYYERKQETL